MSDDQASIGDDLAGKVAVVTGGAGGIGRGIVTALLEAGLRVVIGDIEAPVLDAAVAELAEQFPGGSVRGVRTDVADPASFEALADDVYETEGACHLLFNNAGVSSGGGGKPWEQEANDWRWCFSVNVFGTANGIISFVPRMLESGEPGVVINTSSGDGGLAPVPYASVYASSKAAVSCLTEAVQHQLAGEGDRVRAAIFYPGGGLLDTGLWTAQRNRPDDLARQKERAAAPGTTFEEFKAQLEAAGRPAHVVDLVELGRFAVAGVKSGDFIISYDLDRAGRLLHARADASAHGQLPPHMMEML